MTGVVKFVLFIATVAIISMFVFLGTVLVSL